MAQVVYYIITMIVCINQTDFTVNKKEMHQKLYKF
jgi:hypothetical protein